MPNLLHEFRTRFHELAVAFLWRQWSALGVAGDQGSADQDWIIDPEALVLLSTIFGRHDPRLFDEMLDWLAREGGALNMQRLKTLHHGRRLGDPRVFAAVVATIGGRAGQAKWRSYAQELGGTRPRTEGGKVPRVAVAIPETLTPLFAGVPAMGKPDAVFLNFGWLRGPVALRGLSSAPNPHLRSNFLFKLRALFGLQARAEIMACLLGSGAMHAADIAERTDYFPRTIQLALNEMARSGHVLAFRAAREKYFELRKSDWAFLTPLPFPQWIHWSPVFFVLQAVAEKLEMPGMLDAPASVEAVELRDIPEALTQALRESGLPWQLQMPPNAGGAVFVTALTEQIDAFLQWLSGKGSADAEISQP